MVLGEDVRVCIAYSETDDEMENSVYDELERLESIALGPVHLCWALRVFKYMRQSGAMLWLPRRPTTYCCPRATVGGNEEARKTVDPPSMCA